MSIESATPRRRRLRCERTRPAWTPFDERGIRRVQQHDHRAGGFADDLVDQVQRMLRAGSESDQRDVGPFAGVTVRRPQRRSRGRSPRGPSATTIGATSARRSLRSLAISTRRWSALSVSGATAARCLGSLFARGGGALLIASSPPDELSALASSAQQRYRSTQNASGIGSPTGSMHRPDAARTSIAHRPQHLHRHSGPADRTAGSDLFDHRPLPTRLSPTSQSGSFSPGRAHHLDATPSLPRRARQRQARTVSRAAGQINPN